MTVRDIVSSLNLEVLLESDFDREVKGAYSGDLLSWVMTRLDADFAWITIMNNINVLAVASLSDASCIILTENAEIESSVLEKAKSEGINILRTKCTSFETAYFIGKMLYAE